MEQELRTVLGSNNLTKKKVFILYLVLTLIIHKRRRTTFCEGVWS